MSFYREWDSFESFLVKHFDLRVISQRVGQFLVVSHDAFCFTCHFKESGTVLSRFS